MHTSAGLALLTVSVSSHGAVTSPRPRNSIDSTLAPWNGTVPDYPIPFTHPNWCEAPDAKSQDPRHLSGANGQACFWFNNGPSALHAGRSTRGSQIFFILMCAQC